MSQAVNLIFSGRLFHSLWALTVKAISPVFFSVVLGTTRRAAFVEKLSKGSEM